MVNMQQRSRILDFIVGPSDVSERGESIPDSIDGHKVTALIDGEDYFHALP